MARKRPAEIKQTAKAQPINTASPPKTTNIQPKKGGGEVPSLPAILSGETIATIPITKWRIKTQENKATIAATINGISITI
ncbi:MAG: hypothetical protein KAS99_01565 [Candidatus Omnitrophica bacterium]|nr:hypothetical protein [Candidatus Omnitrophota bacterium]